MQEAVVLVERGPLREQAGGQTPGEDAGGLLHTGSSGSASASSSSSAWAESTRSTPPGTFMNPAGRPISRSRRSGGAAVSMRASTSRSLAAMGESDRSATSRNRAASSGEAGPSVVSPPSVSGNARSRARRSRTAASCRARSSSSSVSTSTRSLPASPASTSRTSASPSPQLGQPPDPRQHDGVPQCVVPVPVGPPLRLRQQPQMAVVPHGPRGDTDGRGKLSDPHDPSRDVDVAAGSSRRPWHLTRAMILCHDRVDDSRYHGQVISRCPSLTGGRRRGVT